MNAITLKFTSLALVLSMLLSSCATTADGRLTQAQGTGGGAALGALLGVALAAATGNADAIGQAAAIGAVTGAAAGFGYGTSVAKKKASYANQEDFLDYAIAQASQDHQKAVQRNNQLAAQVQSLESRYGKLPKGDTQNKSRLDRESQKQFKALDQETLTLNNRIKDYQECLQGASGAKATALRGQVNNLESEKGKLMKAKSRLASAQSRIAI